MIASFEGLRGIAALLVVVHHMFCAQPHRHFVNAYLAVDLFFVLSGFVICRACGAQLSSPAALRTFVIRRVGRLWPTHIATTLLALAVIRRFPPASEMLVLATMSQGLNLFLGGIGNAVSWSAGDEMYVYLVFGAICFLMRSNARIAAFAILALSAYAFAVWLEISRACLFHGGCLNGLVFKLGWMRCIAGFFLGTLVYEFRDRVVALINDPVFQATAFSTSLFLLISADAIPGSALAAPLVFAALIGSLIDDRGPVARLLQKPAAQYLGKVSYPLYLGHGVLLPLVTDIPANTGLMARLVTYALFLFWSFGIAHLLHKYVEVPFRDRFNRWSQATPGALGGLPALGCKSTGAASLPARTNKSEIYECERQSKA
nr:acyltransferase [uncultured Ralstonia sp.]